MNASDLHIRIATTKDRVQVNHNEKLNRFYENNGFELKGITDDHCKYEKIMKRGESI